MRNFKIFKALVVLAGLALPAVSMAAGNVTNETNKNTVSQQVASVVATANVGMVGSRIATLQGPPGAGGATVGTPGGKKTGGSSGSGAADAGAWALGGAFYLDGSKSGASYDGSISTAMVGMDKKFGDALLGIALGYERLALDTHYNDGKIEYDGFSIAPYLSYGINKNLIADAMFSYTMLNYTMKDKQLGVAYSDTMNANRMVTSVGLTQYYPMDNWLFSGRAGTLYLHEHQGSYILNADNYSKSGIYTWQGQLGGRATYDLGSFKPFVGATYMYDFVKSGGSSDQSGVDLDLGVGWNAADSLSFGLTGTYGLRENFYKAGGMLNARYEF